MGRSSRLLLVEDHDYLGHVLIEVLSEAGFDVGIVGGTRDLKPALDTFQPDVILSDFRLRGEDGLDVCRLVRAHPHRPDLPVVLYTAMEPVHSRVREALEHPGVRLVEKSGDYKALIAVICEQLAAPAGLAPRGPRTPGEGSAGLPPAG
jgi:DNA-binding response OmpR family regulator